jgi:hypothetical protein
MPKKCIRILNLGGHQYHLAQDEESKKYLLACEYGRDFYDNPVMGVQDPFELSCASMQDLLKMLADEDDTD